MAIKALTSALALTLLSFGFSVHAQESPRSYVGGIAAVIEENYFDEHRAKKIATDLRKAAAKGRFDALKDKHELSSELSTWLDPLDTHFDVTWDEPELILPETPEQDGPAIILQKRNNHGIRTIEVLPGNIGYLDLRHFIDFEFGEPNQPARQAMDAALQLLSAANAVIIDLRDNGGGAPQMVGYLSSAFVKKNADIFNTFHGRGRTMSEAPLDWHPSPRLEVPLFILTSGRTASAAEAFAYTLQSAKRAMVIGETSMGAANPGAKLDAGNGFMVFVSFASPINPITKTNWEGRGVMPDVSVTSENALFTAKREALKTVLNSKLPESDVTAVRWALDALMAEVDTSKAVESSGYIGSYGNIVVADKAGRLMLKNGRRPIRTLLALGEDQFAVQEDPSVRVVFERDSSGHVHAMESRNANGNTTRYRRNVEP